MSGLRSAADVENPPIGFIRSFSTRTSRLSWIDAARHMKAGTFGLYRLLAGMPVVPAQTSWFAKPDRTTYAAFAPVRDAAIDDGSTTWQRRMVLGPAPEYAVQTLTQSIDVGERIIHVALSGPGGNEMPATIAAQ